MPNTEMIEERLRFLEIDQNVIEELQNARTFLEPELDRMLEKFYAHYRRYMQGGITGPGSRHSVLL